MGLSFLPGACRPGAGTGTTGVVATGVNAGVGVAVGRVADVPAEELSEDGTASSLRTTTGTFVGAENSTAGTGEEKGVEAIDNAGVRAGTRARAAAASGVGVEAGNPKDGAMAKGFVDPVTAAGIPPILGEAEDCDNRKKGAAATKLLPALLDGIEEPKPVFDPKIEGFCASDDGFEKPNDEDTGTDKGAGVKEDPMGCVKVLD